MNDYRIKVTIRNARFLTAMESSGIRTLAELSRISGVKYSTVVRIADLKIPVINEKTGDYVPGVIEICDTLSTMPSDLWSEQMLRQPLSKTTVEVDVTGEELAALSAPTQSSEELMIADQREAVVLGALKTLPDRYRQIIECWFGINGSPMTLREVGKKFGISQERVRQIAHRGCMTLKRNARRAEDKSQVRRMAG